MTNIQPLAPTYKQLEDFAVEEQFLLFCDADEFTQIARAVLAKWGTPQPVAREPVAWLNPWRADQVTTDYDAYGEHGIPLYTAPQPVEREPLTDEWIRSRCKEPWVFETAKQWVRMAEAAHGINKGGQHGTE